MENNENVEVVQTNTTPAANNGKGMSIAALVCGILGIVGSFIPVVTYFTFVLSILGIIFGVKGNKIAKATGEGKGMPTVCAVSLPFLWALSVFPLVYWVSSALPAPALVWAHLPACNIGKQHVQTQEAVSAFLLEIV